MIWGYLSPNNFIKIYEGCFDGSREDGAGRWFAGAHSGAPTVLEDRTARNGYRINVGLHTPMSDCVGAGER